MLGSQNYHNPTGGIFFVSNRSATQHVRIVTGFKSFLIWPANHVAHFNFFSQWIERSESRALLLRPTIGCLQDLKTLKILTSTGRPYRAQDFLSISGYCTEIVRQQIKSSDIFLAFNKERGCAGVLQSWRIYTTHQMLLWRILGDLLVLEVLKPLCWPD